MRRKTKRNKNKAGGSLYRPSGAITHETVDHFLSLVLVCLFGGRSPNMWKLDVSQACSYSLEVARFMLGGVWATKNISGCPNTNLCPSDRRLQSMVGIRIGCLLKDIMVCVFQATCCRFVDDFFGVDPAGCE